MVQKLTAVFKEKFAVEPFIFSSPGRINIIGEHTDYNEGFVLPAAINKHVFVAISKREDEQINLYACDYAESYTTTLKDIRPATVQWPNYILGVVDQLHKNGNSIGGFNLAIDGDIPIGAGLSSSAAVECAVIFALNQIFILGLSKLELVKFAQKAEHVFAGVNCGIMDQFASMFGKKDQAIKLDCRSLEFEYIPLKLSGYKIILFNTNVKHNLASSEYNTRRAQCEKAVSLIRQFHPTVKNLRDVSMEMLHQHVEPFDQLIYKRSKYVVEENERLLGACEDLRNSDITSLGKKMFSTHQGLRHEYEVSCKELDYLVDYVQTCNDVAGARMVGGGFGGCTLNIIKETAVEKLVYEIGKDYKQSMNLPLTAYEVSVENGTGEINL